MNTLIWKVFPANHPVGGDGQVVALLDMRYIAGRSKIAHGCGRLICRKSENMKKKNPSSSRSNSEPEVGKMKLAMTADAIEEAIQKPLEACAYRVRKVCERMGEEAIHDMPVRLGRTTSGFVAWIKMLEVAIKKQLEEQSHDILENRAKDERIADLEEKIRKSQ